MHVVLGVILCVLGAGYLVFPKFFWTITNKWMVKSSDPSPSSLVVSRVTGLIVVVLSVFIIAGRIPVYFGGHRLG